MDDLQKQDDLNRKVELAIILIKEAKQHMDAIIDIFREGLKKCEDHITKLEIAVFGESPD